MPVEGWFDFSVPTVSIDRSWISKTLAAHDAEKRHVPQLDPSQRDRRVLWLGTRPDLRVLAPESGKPPRAELVLHDTAGAHTLEMPLSWALWLQSMLERAAVRAAAATTLSALESSWDMWVESGAMGDAAPSSTSNGEAAPSFNSLLQSDAFQKLMDHGLVVDRAAPPPVIAVTEAAPAAAAPIPSDSASSVAATHAAAPLFRDFLHTPVWQALRERGLALL